MKGAVIMKTLEEELARYMPEVWSPPDEELTGLLIVLCGFDGSGKSTQVGMLAKKFTTLGKEVVITRQPTDWYRSQPAVQSLLRGGRKEDALYLALLAATDRRAHINQTILPALRQGTVVISDRYLYSTFCYFLLRGLSVKRIAELNRCIPRPSAAFYLDVPAETLMDRIVQRDGGLVKREERSVESISSAITTFRLLSSGEHSLTRVDGTRSIGQVHSEIWRNCNSYI